MTLIKCQFQIRCSQTPVKLGPCTCSFRSHPSFKVVRKRFSRHYFTFCNIKIVWLHQIMRRCGFTFRSIGDKFESTNLRSYRSKSEFYDAFKQDKCLRLDFKRIFICLCLRRFDVWKTRINGSPSVYGPSSFLWMFSLLLKEVVFLFLFAFTAAGVVLCAAVKRLPVHQDQDSLLVKCRNDNHSPGPVVRELVPSSHQRSELSNTALCVNHSAVYILFWCFEISVNILRNQ